MTVENIISSIDAEITRLQQARALLAGNGPGRSKKASPAVKSGPRRRTMSAEGRARIAEAQRKRWAAQKKKAK